MKRNEVTTLDKLQIGDRFYKSGDAKKTVWTLKQPSKNLNQYDVMKDGETYPRPMKGNAPVVFLRSAMGSPVTS